MPAPTVVEILGGASGTSGTTIPIATALVPNDLIVVVSSTAASAANQVTPSGLGTWSGVLGGVNGGGGQYGFRVNTLTGVTGGGNITLSVTPVSVDYVVMVIRDLPQPVLDGFDARWVTSSGITTSDRQARARDNSVAVSIVHSISGAPGNPSAADPGSGWVLDRNTSGTGGISVAHNVIVAGQLVDVTTTHASFSSDFAVGLFVFGTPLEARDYAQSVDVIHDGAGTQPPRALSGQYAEAITGDSDPDVGVAFAALEVLSTEAAGTAKVAAAPFEVIAKMTPDAEIVAAYAETLTTEPTAASAVVGAEMEVLSQAPPTPTVYGQYAEAIAPPAVAAADAAIYSADVQVITAAREAHVEGVYLEAIRLYVVPGPGSDRFVGWGIPI